MNSMHKLTSGTMTIWNFKWFAYLERTIQVLKGNLLDIDKFKLQLVDKITSITARALQFTLLV